VDARAALECAEQAAALRARSTAEAVPTDGARCNVLGVHLPGHCNALDPTLRAAALRLGQRCTPGLPHERDALAVPPDFQITWRRGRAASSLDHEPRYVLALYGDGSVVFHGRSFVSNTGRNDGRTLPWLVGTVVARLRELDWFERRGGSWNPDACGTQEQRGDLITVHAGTRERMVVDREGCRGPFTARELGELRDLVERVAGIAGWTTPVAEEDTTRVSEWIVNAE
jgi:hypothetical protein